MPLKNKVTEKELRESLSSQGYAGQTARVQRLELIAVVRPGWKQVFEFSVEAKHLNEGWKQLYGVLRDDQRHQTKPEVFIAESEDEVQAVSEKWTEGHLQVTVAKMASIWVMVAVGVALVGLFGLVIGVHILLNR